MLVIISRQPQANIIDTVDRMRALLPQLRANIPPAAQLEIASDRSTVIRASLRTVEQSLTIAIILVVLVVYVFLRDGRAVLVPAVAVPVSLVGTFAAMYLLGYSLDNLSLMALTIATGFVVDDAIVVMENIVRNMENGVPRFQAALIGVRQVGFTVLFGIHRVVLCIRGHANFNGLRDRRAYQFEHLGNHGGEAYLRFFFAAVPGKFQDLRHKIPRALSRSDYLVDKRYLRGVFLLREFQKQFRVPEYRHKGTSKNCLICPINA